MRRTWIIGGALVAVVATTTLWRFAFSAETPSHGPETTSVVESTGAPSTRPSGTDAPATAPIEATTAEADRSQASAVRAAIRFLELDQDLFPVTSPQRARELSESITSSGSRRRLSDRAEDHQREILAKGDLAGLVLRLAPITVRVRNHTDRSSTVDVYLLRLWSFPDKGALDDYATAQIDLVWEDDQWRLSDASVIDGPYPVARFSARPLIASTAQQFEATLSGYDDRDLYR